MKKEGVKIAIIVAIILLAAASRLVKHPFNFTPIVAMAIFSGFYLKKYWGMAFPLAAMLVSDYFIGFYNWQVMASVYVAIIITYGIGWFLSKHKKWYNILFSAIASSIIFFIVTNFAVWAFFDWYPHTWSGLLSCFTLAIPFFRNSFIGDVAYTGAFFTVFELARVTIDRKMIYKLAI